MREDPLTSELLREESGPPRRVSPAVEVEGADALGRPRRRQSDQEDPRHRYQQKEMIAATGQVMEEKIVVIAAARGLPSTVSLSCQSPACISSVMRQSAYQASGRLSCILLLLISR